jgi:uncharacterized protein YggU (UPF0235/DUF167 family)
VPSETRFIVRLTPRGGADRVDGVGDDGVLRVRVAAAPVDGAANRALIRLLAGELGVAAGRVSIVSGVGARRKTIVVESLGREAILARWPGLRL